MAAQDGLHVASARVWVELLHAEVASLLAAAGIPVLHIKGPTVALWLYGAGERDWGDVDVLVAPGQMQDALEVLYAHQFVDRYPGVNRGTSTDHAVTLHRVDPAIGGDEVDVHDRFVGIDSDAARAFELLWSRREPARLANVDVWFPDLTSRAVLVCLNTARSSASDKAHEDLRRLLAAPVEWDLVVSLARRLGALPAMRAGLELSPAGQERVTEIGLASVAVTPEWRMRVAGAPRTALRLDELRRLPWTSKAPVLARWIAPPPSIMRMREPGMGEGWPALCGAYLRRLGQGLRSLPASARAFYGTR